METANLLINIITAIGTIVPIMFGVYTYQRDSKRKAQQDTIEAYMRLQNEVLSKISRLKPGEVRVFAADDKSEGYKQFTEYMMAIECFCIGIEKNIYDFDVFYSLARDYFNKEKGPIKPTILPMLEVKKKKGDYYQSMERIWERMAEKKPNNSSH